MKKPKNLVREDHIGILSTARRTKPSELKTGLKLIDQWSLKSVIGKSIGIKENQFAGDDELRANDFQTMLDDPKIKAIWCAKGGYGSVRILDKLDFSKFKKKPKWIIGYSDVTALHSHIHNMGIETLHAQMPVDIENKSEEAAESIRKVLFGEKYKIEIASHSKLTRTGKAKGELVGGNLSMLYSLCGSNSAIKTEGKILFLEDLDEYLYHIDRMMINLKRNAMLDKLSGLIVGGMSDMNDNAVSFGKTAEEIIFDSVKEYNYPVCFNFPVGHIKDNRALILGRKSKLVVENNRLTLEF